MFILKFNSNGRKWPVVVAALVGCAPGLVNATTCSPLNFDEQKLLQTKSEDFAIANPGERERFVVELVDCLGDPEPHIRDGIAYEGILTLLRGQQLQPETIEVLRVLLVGKLLEGEPDEAGFRRPFVALALAEVARADRITPIFGQKQRQEIVTVATAYMQGIDDYRGFDEKDGWRHGVAHGADLLMQLVLNPKLTEAQILQIRHAIGSQVRSRGEHFYVYGESERLARPVLFMAARGAYSEQQWMDWFQELADAEPFDQWEDVFASQAGLAKLHNTRAFAEAVYVRAVGSDKPEVEALAAGALALLRELP
jgi:hypothetical protein